MNIIIKTWQAFIILMFCFFATLTYAQEIRIDYADNFANPTGNWNIIGDSIWS